jgi:hypothetical protein
MSSLFSSFFYFFIKKCPKNILLMVDSIAGRYKTPCGANGAVWGYHVVSSLNPENPEYCRFFYFFPKKTLRSYGGLKSGLLEVSDMITTLSFFYFLFS